MDFIFFSTHTVTLSSIMQKLLLLAVICCIQPLIMYCQDGRLIHGVVFDDATSLPLPGANIRVLKTSLQTTSDLNGRFRLKPTLAKSLQLEVSYVGYHTERIEIKEDSMVGEIEVRMMATLAMGEEVVVTASRRLEKVTQAPASVRVVSSKEIRKYAGANVFGLLANQPGIDFFRSGVDAISINARGFNQVFNNKVFLLIDNRNSMAVVSSNVPTYNNSTVQRDDIDRIEVVIGPNAALYGPNVHNAMVNIITRHPRQSQGTTLALGAGNRYQFSGRLRHAMAINERWAFKVLGEYSTGKEFTFYDSVYAGGPPYGPRVAIPERNVDFTFRRFRGEGHLHYQASSKTEIIVSGGTSNNSSIGLTGTGRNQMRNLVPSFVQARLVNPRFFVNVYKTMSKMGSSYSIPNYTRDFWNRTHSTISTSIDPQRGYLPPDSAELFALRPGNTFVEESSRWNAEVQFNQSLAPLGIQLVAALNYQQDNPDGKGVGLADDIKPIEIRQYGGALQLEKQLPWKMKVVAAARLDLHSNFENMFAPKLSVSQKLADGWARLSWSKAYSVPSVLWQYSKSGGVTFGNGEGISYIPNGLPVEDLASIRNTTPLIPEEVNTFEMAYKGNLGKKWFVDVNGWYSFNKNFFTSGISVSGRALSMGDVPVVPANPGFVTPNGILRGASFNSYFNFGEIQAYGIDASIAFKPSSSVLMTAGYSWQDSNIDEDNPKNDANKDGFQSAEERSMNAPNHKLWLGLSLQQLWRKRLFIDVRMRHVSQFDFYSGNQIATETGKGKRGVIDMGPNPPVFKNFDHGPLGGFTSFDFNALCRLNDISSLAITITNMFNTTQIEAAGSPSIARLINLEYRVELPVRKK